VAILIRLTDRPATLFEGPNGVLKSYSEIRIG